MPYRRLPPQGEPASFFAGLPASTVPSLNNRVFRGHRVNFIMAALRGVYRDGVIVLEGDPASIPLRDGETVEVRKKRRAKTTRNSKRPKTPKARSGTRAARALEAHDAVWRNRADWKGLSSVKALSMMRADSAERRRAR
jgi:hypothetical protein